MAVFDISRCGYASVVLVKVFGLVLKCMSQGISGHQVDDSLKHSAMDCCLNVKRHIFDKLEITIYWNGVGRYIFSFSTAKPWSLLLKNVQRAASEQS